MFMKIAAAEVASVVRCQVPDTGVLCKADQFINRLPSAGLPSISKRAVFLAPWGIWDVANKPKPLATSRLWSVNAAYPSVTTTWFR